MNNVKQTLNIVSKDEALTKAKELFDQGWEIYQLDDPPSATKGLVLSRYIDTVTGEQIVPSGNKNITEETVNFCWTMFDKQLVSFEKNVEPDKLLAYVNNNPDCYSCDDMYKGKVGFVWYKPKAGGSFVMQTDMKDLKLASETVRNALFNHRESVYNSQKALAEFHQLLIDNGMVRQNG